MECVRRKACKLREKDFCGVPDLLSCTNKTNSKGADMADQQEKVKGVVDIVFLMDATGSMGNCIDKLKKNVMLFFRSLTEMDPEKQTIPPVKDWRAKVVGFRDVDADGVRWLEDNDFTRSVAEIERQLGALVATGGGDEPESLLDAIYKVADAQKTPRGVEEPKSWRDRHDAARAIVAFTDATFKPRMTAPGIAGGDIQSLRNLCVQERILLTVVAPRGIPGDECFEGIGAIRYANWVDVPAGSGGSPIDEFMNNGNALNETIARIAKTITKTATDIAL